MLDRLTLHITDRLDEIMIAITALLIPLATLTTMIGL